MVPPYFFGLNGATLLLNGFLMVPPHFETRVAPVKSPVKPPVKPASETRISNDDQEYERLSKRLAEFERQLSEQEEMLKLSFIVFKAG